MSQNPCQIRLALPNDAEDISALYSQLMNTVITVDAHRINQISQLPNSALFVSDCQSRICATALVTLCDDIIFGHRPFAVIENIVVLDSLRDQGIGTRLFQAIEKFCREKQCYKITITSSANRNRAHHFFERLKFDGNTKNCFVKYLNY